MTYFNKISKYIDYHLNTNKIIWICQIPFSVVDLHLRRTRSWARCVTWSPSATTGVTWPTITTDVCSKHFSLNSWTKELLLKADFQYRRPGTRFINVFLNIGTINQFKDISKSFECHKSRGQCKLQSQIWNKIPKKHWLFTKNAF